MKEIYERNESMCLRIGFTSALLDSFVPTIQGTLNDSILSCQDTYELLLEKRVRFLCLEADIIFVMKA